MSNTTTFGCFQLIAKFIGTVEIILFFKIFTRQMVSRARLNVLIPFSATVRRTFIPCQSDVWPADWAIQENILFRISCSLVILTESKNRQTGICRIFQGFQLTRFVFCS